MLDENLELGSFLFQNLFLKRVGSVELLCFMIPVYVSAGPHANAHKHHVTNELRMLERFG